jgi:hypothetical protein
MQRRVGAWEKREKRDTTRSSGWRGVYPIRDGMEGRREKLLLFCSSLFLAILTGPSQPLNGRAMVLKTMGFSNKSSNFVGFLLWNGIK